MGIVKFGLISLLTLFLVLTGLSLLFPSDLRVSRVINVAAPRQQVFAAISDFRAWKQWNAFAREASLTNKIYSSPSGGKGAFLRSDQLVVTETNADSNGVALNWNLTGGKQFKGGFEILSPNSDSLTVQWSFYFHFRWYPWEKLGVFVYDRKLGPAMEESLKGLKQFVENSR
jgi:Polyketide cyclase / dehydrase and lipid transport